MNELRHRVVSLDDVLGLAPRDKCALGVGERALWAATEVSYDKAESFLAKFTCLAVSHGSIHRMAVEEGLRLLETDAREREAVLASGQGAGRCRTSMISQKSISERATTPSI